MLRLTTPTGTRAIGVLVVDLDRTLTDPSLRVVPAALAEVQRARKHGVKTILATGRPFREIPGGAGTLHVFDVGILEGGAVIHEGGAVQDARSSDDWTRRLAGWLRERNVPFRQAENSFSIAVEDASHLAAYPDGDRLELSANVDRVDVTPAGVHKGSALAQVLDGHDALPGECLVFADAANDLGMFRVADYRVAVENAEEIVKSAADEVAPGFGGQAVADFLRTRLKEGET